MGVKARVQDAVFLWEHGRREGALLVALVAVAATARSRFPRPMRDQDAFEKFLESAHSVRLKIEFRGELHAVEHIFYKWLRCELVHEGSVPVDIEFVKGTAPGVLSIRAGGAPDFLLQVSEGWFHHLVGAVVAAPENQAEFSADDVV